MKRGRWLAATGGAVVGAISLAGLDHLDVPEQLAALAFSLGLGLLVAWALARHARPAFTAFAGFLGAFLGPLLIAFVVFLATGD
jgi:hypothetical protein